jgi:hypothetical protein
MNHRTRSALRWVAASSVALSLMVAAVPAQAAAPVASHLRATAAPATVLIGGSVVVSGAVSPSVAGSPVVLQKLVNGHWATLTHRATGKGGSYSFKVRTAGKPATWSLRVIRSSSSKAKAIIGKTLKVHLTKTAYKVTSTVVTKVNSGDPVVVSGKVTPKSSGQVILQVLHLGKWRTLATGKLAGSAYSFSKKLPPKTYPLRVVKPYSAKIATGASRPANVTVFPAPGVVTRPTVSPKLALGSQDDSALALPGSRLVFSTIKSAATPARTFTFTNTGNAPATVSGLAIQGTDAASFGLAPGQPTTFVVPAGGSATVSVVFHPTATTNCPTGTTYPNAYLIGDSVRQASLVFTTTDPGFAGGSGTLAGINSCDFSGNNEPILGQVLQALGYTDVVQTATGDQRFLGQSVIAGTDEIASPYFTVANPALPVSVVPLAHYSTADTRPYHATGWFPKGAVLGTDSSCNANCHQAFAFPAEATSMTYTQNQRLLPVPTGATTFTPTGPFGLYTGEFSDVNFTDDHLNIAHGTDNKDLVPAQTLHDMRVYPAFGPGHVAIPNTYLVAIDVTRVPAFKNFDFQDVVLIVRNVVPSS